MRITCPSCAAQYEVDAEDISPTGQEFQCSDCLNIWSQSRDGSVAEITPDKVVEDTPNAEEDIVTEDNAPAIEIDEPIEEVAEEAVIIDFPEVFAQEPAVDLPTDITEFEVESEVLEDEATEIVDESAILEEIIAEAEIELPEIIETSAGIDTDPEETSDVISNLDDIEILTETPSSFTYTPVFEGDTDPISLHSDPLQDSDTPESTLDEDVDVADDLSADAETPELADMPFMAPPVSEDFDDGITNDAEIEEVENTFTDTTKPEEEPAVPYYQESAEIQADDSAETTIPEELETPEDPSTFDDPFETIIITEDDIIVADEPETTEEVSFAEEIEDTVEAAPLVETHDLEDDAADLDQPETVIVDELGEIAEDETDDTEIEEMGNTFEDITVSEEEPAMPYYQESVETQADIIAAEEVPFGIRYLRSSATCRSAGP